MTEAVSRNWDRSPETEADTRFHDLRDSGYTGPIDQDGNRVNDQSNPHVFLGGSCDPTTWRKDIAIPALDAAGVTYYNPQVEEWTPDLIQLEAEAKDRARQILFVIDGRTRAIASMLEATEMVCTRQRKSVVIVVQDIADNTEIDGHVITGRELKDLNRARAYFRDIVARRHGIPVHDTIEEALEGIISVAQWLDQPDGSGAGSVRPHD